MKREARNSLHSYQFKNNNHERNQLKEFYILCGNKFEENVLSAFYKNFMEKIEIMEKYITLSIVILLIAICTHAQQPENTLFVNADSGKTIISKYIYGASWPVYLRRYLGRHKFPDSEQARHPK
jgi:HJR/Mrr/RecB family endonuclease